MLIPTRENITKLFETHQNQCAFHDCDRQIIDSDAHVQGNVFFIESNKKDQPRFNQKLSNEKMIDYNNLILLCDIHGFDIEWKEKIYPVPNLLQEIRYDKKYLKKYNFKLTNEMMEKMLFHFIDHYDPDRLAHIEVKSIKYDGGGIWDGGCFTSGFICTGAYIKPTKQFQGKKFEIIDTRRKIREFDKVVFYPKTSTYAEGIQADIEIKSHMTIEGIVPDFPKGDYFVSLRSAIDDSSKFEKDLSFTIM